MNWWTGTACARVRARASAFLDGRLTAAQRAAVQQHLHTCCTCKGELQQVARLARAMHNLPPFRLADGMASRLRRQLAVAPVATRPSPPRALARRVTGFAVLAAAAVALFALGYRCGRHDAGVSGPSVGPAGSQPPAATAAEGRPMPQRAAPRAPQPPLPDIEPAPRANARWANFGEPLPAELPWFDEVWTSLRADRPPPRR